MSRTVPTNAASSGVRLDRKELKTIARRSDRPGLVYLAQWAAGLALGGAVVWAALTVVLRRSPGRNTRAPGIRQAPHMITEGGYARVARRTM